MRTVFFGTPAWAVPSLEALMGSRVEVSGVVTNPDRPAGRGMKLTASPVKQAASSADIEVVQPPKARDPELAEWLRAKDVDAAVVVAYGKILPADLLAIPPHGFINVHFSLLPAYRGAAPVQRAVMEGSVETGVSIMRLTEGMDEGPVFAVATDAIGPDDTAGEVGSRLAVIGAELLVSTLAGIEAGDAVATEQDHDRATYAPKITDAEGEIDWSASSKNIHDLVRGLNPVPGAWTTFDGRRLKVHATSQAEAKLSPREMALVDGSLVAGTGDGSLELVEVQGAGKRRMTGAEFARGLHAMPWLLSGP